VTSSRNSAITPFWTTNDIYPRKDRCAGRGAGLPTINENLRSLDVGRLPDVRVSRIRLSDWFHRKHTAHVGMSDVHAPPRLGVAIQPSRKAPGLKGYFAGFRQSPGPRVLRQAHQKSESFPPPELPGFGGTTTLSDFRTDRCLMASLRPLPSSRTDLPRLRDGTKMAALSRDRQRISTTDARR
jgi:hypothetical protein